MHHICAYLLSHQLEVWGFIFGIAYVVLATRQSVWCWPAGIVNVLMYIIVFYRSGLYGDSALQLFYLGISFYGLFLWLTPERNSAKPLQIQSTSSTKWIWLSTFTFLSTILFGFLLDTFTDSEIPYWDGLTTALGVFATWMTARKLLENWLVWVFTNVLCTAIYFYKELYTTMIFYFILALLAFNGYYQWKKQLTAPQA
jgi:nicotinamide mononucleotide transporter